MRWWPWCGMGEHQMPVQPLVPYPHRHVSKLLNWKCRISMWACVACSNGGRFPPLTSTRRNETDFPISVRIDAIWPWTASLEDRPIERDGSGTMGWLAFLNATVCNEIICNHIMHESSFNHDISWKSCVEKHNFWPSTRSFSMRIRARRVRLSDKVELSSLPNTSKAHLACPKKSWAIGHGTMHPVPTYISMVPCQIAHHTLQQASCT